MNKNYFTGIFTLLLCLLGVGCASKPSQIDIGITKDFTIGASNFSTLHNNVLSNNKREFASFIVTGSEDNLGFTTIKTTNEIMSDDLSTIGPNCYHNELVFCMNGALPIFLPRDVQSATVQVLGKGDFKYQIDVLDLNLKPLSISACDARKFWLSVKSPNRKKVHYAKQWEDFEREGPNEFFSTFIVMSFGAIYYSETNYLFLFDKNKGLIEFRRDYSDNANSRQDINLENYGEIYHKKGLSRMLKTSDWCEY